MATIITGGDDVRREMLASYISLIVVTSSLVTLRFFTKWKYVHNVGPEDLACAASFICASIMTGFFCRDNRNKIFFFTKRDILDRTEPVSLGIISEFSKSLYFATIFYLLSLFTTKLSFLLQYLRIFRTKKLRIATWIVLGSTLVYGGWTFFSTIFFCWPIESFWNGQIDKCLPLDTLILTNSIFNIVTDILIYVLPLPGIRRLMLPTSRKLGLFLVFTFGGFVCITSVLRLVAVLKTDLFDDRKWAGQTVSMWSAIEANIAIVCSCLPTIRPLVSRIWSHFSPTSLSSTGATRGTTRASRTARRNDTALVSIRTSADDSDSKQLVVANTSDKSSSSIPYLSETADPDNSIRKTYEITQDHSDANVTPGLP